MNTQKLTKKALEAINSAQSIALENQNMQIMPEHLLYALADQEGGLIPQLLKRSGADIAQFASNFGSAVVNFFIMALILFFLLKGMNKLLSLGKKPAAPAAPTTKKCPYCQSEIPIAATRCPHCTSVLEEAEVKA